VRQIRKKKNQLFTRDKTMQKVQESTKNRRRR
jgi:hypothetical protein